MRANWKTIVGILISASFLYLAFRKVDLNELKATFQAADYVYVVPSMLLIMASVWFRTLRWRFLLKPVKTIPLPSLFSSTMIGLMANNLLPARLGEFVRAYTVGVKERISKSSSLATIVVERIFDGFTLLFFLAVISVFRAREYPPWLRHSAYIALSFYICAAILLVLLKVRTEPALRILSALTTPLPGRIRDRIIHLLHSFIEGLQVLHSTSDVLISAILSLLVWLPYAVTIHLLLGSFDIVLPVQISFLVLVAMGIGVMIPSAPGYIGTIQFVCVAVLSAFSVTRDEALSFSILYHVCTYIPVTAVGLIYLLIEGISFAEMRDSVKQT
ncbi:MAG: flippase-like domain-containing protein [bacterium]|nr:MAG: flippase-like domain-containing protein [bacterium]